MDHRLLTVEHCVALKVYGEHNQGSIGAFPGFLAIGPLRSISGRLEFDHSKKFIVSIDKISILLQEIYDSWTAIQQKCPRKNTTVYNSNPGMGF